MQKAISLVLETRKKVKVICAPLAQLPAQFRALFQHCIKLFHFVFIPLQSTSHFLLILHTKVALLRNYTSMEKNNDYCKRNSTRNLARIPSLKMSALLNFLYILLLVPLNLYFTCGYKTHIFWSYLLASLIVQHLVKTEIEKHGMKRSSEVSEAEDTKALQRAAEGNGETRTGEAEANAEQASRTAEHPED